MKTVELNGKRMTSEASAQEYLFDMFDFPVYYGDDLDALYDALADIVEETHVTIINREAMENSSYGSRLMWVFEDAADDNDNLTLAWTEEESGEYE
ncbi:MAG: barstar family protein [Solobacterium sp.]|nr:barstar family protein [Solobacterium sp.]